MSELEQSSYIFPSDSEIYSYPYVVVKSGAKGYLGANSPVYKIDVRNDVARLETMLDTVIAHESAKEKKLITNYLNKIQETDPEFYQIISPFLSFNSLGDISRAFDLIERYRRGLLDITKNLPNELQRWDKFWENFQNRRFIYTMNDVFNNIDENSLLNMTPDQLLLVIQEKIEKQWNSDYNWSQERYSSFVTEVMNNLRNNAISGSSILDLYSQPIKNMDQDDYVVSVRKKDKKKASYSALKIVEDWIFGILNGLPTEVFVTFTGGGAGTGRVTQTVNTMTVNDNGEINQLKKQAIQTDVFSIVDTDFMAKIQENQELSKIADSENAVNERIINYLDTIDPNEAFEIHYSVKDQSRSKDYGIKNVGAIDIRKEAGLDSRLATLKEIASVVDGGSAITDIVFILANSGKGMLYDGSSIIKQAERALGYMCAAYMFEDYLKTFQSANDFIPETALNMTNKIHIYFANGHFYPLSEILSFTKQRLNGITKIDGNKLNSIASVLFKPTSNNVYATGKYGKQDISSYTGIDKWNAVRAVTFSESKISVNFNIGNLEALVNSIFRA